jgi:hypothetical protein
VVWGKSVLITLLKDLPETRSSHLHVVL